MLFKKMTNDRTSKGIGATADKNTCHNTNDLNNSSINNNHNKRTNSIKSAKALNRSSYSSTITTSSTIQSSVTRESTAPSTPSNSPTIVDDEMPSVNNNNNNNNNNNKHRTSSGKVDRQYHDKETNYKYKSVAPPQNPGLRLSRTFVVEEEKAKQLREEIARQSQDLRKLEEIAADLQVPKLSRVQQQQQSTGSSNIATSNDSSIFSSSSTSLQQGYSSTRVIETLQHNIDSLKRELRDQTEIAREEARGREALAKRCDIIESSQAILKHQYGSMSQLLDRKERRIKELEEKILGKDKKILDLQIVTNDHLGVQKEMESKLKSFEEDRNRLEIGYKALLESSKSLKQKYHQEVTLIGEKLEDIRNGRQADLDKLAALEMGVSQQRVTQQQLANIEVKAQNLQTSHIDIIKKIYDDIQKKVGDSDEHINIQVDHVNQLVEQLNNFFGERPNAEPLNSSLVAKLLSFPLNCVPPEEIVEG